MWANTPRRADALNHVYVHVPFCKSICHFCNYERLRPSHPEQLRRWRRRVIATIEAMAPAMRGLTFHTLYFGGGTPSVLPADAVREVVTALDRTLGFHPEANRLFEMDPAVMTPARMTAWRDGGFRHVSFGVQTLDPDVNAQHDRGRQGREVVAKRFQELDENGFPDVSCDFLFGLAGTSVEQILDEIREVLVEHRPKWLDVFQLVPTPVYVDRHFGGEIERFWEHLRPFQERGAEGLAAIAKETGYQLSSGQDHRFTLNRIRGNGHRGSSRFSYSQLVSEQHCPLNLLAFGPSARSRIFGEAWMTYEDPEGTDGPGVFDGCRVDLDDESRCYMIYTLRDGDRIGRAAFRQIFGADLTERARLGVAAMLAEGVATLEDTALRMHSSDRRQRAADLLWLVEEERIEREIAKQMGFSLRPAAIWRRLRPLEAGVDVGGFSLLGVQEGRVLLQGAARPDPITLRCTPPLGADPPGLLIESGVPASVQERRALRRAVSALRRVMARAS